MSITSIKVPPAVESGSESVVLDCEYVLAPHEKQGLVVQWFFRDGTVPVYQWIPGKRPQVSGPLKGRINLEHRVSDDPHHRHRALEIINATTDLGGDYRCKVTVISLRKYFLLYCNALFCIRLPRSTTRTRKRRKWQSTVRTGASHFILLY